MSSLPFEVHEVLEQEYVSMYGPVDVPPPEYGTSDIIDEAWARAVCAACGADCGAGIVPALNALVASRDLRQLRVSPAITDTGRDLIDHYDDYTEGVSDARRREINRRIVDDAFLGAIKLHRDIRLSALYTKLHARNDEEARTALCISGGGIRTATFALGIIQGLAGARILDKFHYLSTVSGGGYIGSWLSSWSRRHPSGIAGVQDDLVRADTAVEGVQPNVTKSDRPVKKVDPEPRPLRHLRAYSNYMSPKLGFLSADTWTMASMYVRNLLLNLLVLIPILAAILAIPRLFALLLRHDTQSPTQFPTTALLIVASAALAVGFGYLGATRPTVHGRHASGKSLRGTGGFFFPVRDSADGRFHGHQFVLGQSRRAAVPVDLGARLDPLCDRGRRDDIAPRRDLLLPFLHQLIGRRAPRAAGAAAWNGQEARHGTRGHAHRSGQRDHALLSGREQNLRSSRARSA